MRFSDEPFFRRRGGDTAEATGEADITLTSRVLTNAPTVRKMDEAMVIRHRHARDAKTAANGP